MGRIFISFILLGVLFLCGAFLLNIPNLYLEQGLPLFPAILSAEASVMAVTMCGYGLYRVWFPGRSGPARPEGLAAGDRPWLANPSWARGRVTCSAKSMALFLWFFIAHWWAAIWLMVIDRGPAIMEEGGFLPVGAAILILIGVFSVWAAIKKTVQWLTYGRSTLIIETLPGRPGQQFEASIRTNFKSKPKKAFLMRLTGAERHWTSSDHATSDEIRRRHSVHEQVPFHESTERVAPAKMTVTEGRIHLPVRFAIPEAAPSSGYASDEVEIVWKIDIHKTGRDDPEYEAVFEIPVFTAN